MRIVAAVVALLACVFPSNAAVQEKPLFTFGVLADVQYADAPTAGSRDYRASLSKLDDCIRDFNAKKLAFVISLGDIIDHDIISFDTVVPHYNKLKAKHYHALGNHDFACKVDSKSEILKKLGMKDHYYDFTRGAWMFIVLDGNDVGFMANAKDTSKCMDASEAIDAAKFAEAQAMIQEVRDKKGPNAQPWNGGIGKTQLTWLKSRLDRASRAKQSVVIFCHFPIFPAGGDCNLWNDDELVRTIEPYKCVKAWVNGHNHAGNYGQKNGIHYLTVEGMVETSNTTAYSVFEVYSDRLDVVGTGRTKARSLAISR